jgi:hypothetical protein
MPFAVSLSRCLRRQSKLGLLIALISGSVYALPQPGEVYREYTTSNGGNDWRVTNPAATDPGALAFLPNPILATPSLDLTHAVRAEAVLDVWGGHLRTRDRQLRFNGHDWLDVPRPLLPGTEVFESLYYTQHNPTIEVPLAHLQSGPNTFEGTCTHSFTTGWGQWGLYALTLRIYYDPAKVTAPTGQITSPVSGATLTETPTVTVDAQAASGIKQIDVIAWYDGYDENGDGVGLDWHESRFVPSRGASPMLRDHVGSVTAPPYSIYWDATQVPDQPAADLKLVARIQDQNGLWFVTPIVEDLTLERTDFSVRLIGADELPPAFGMRTGALDERSLTLTLPTSIALNQIAEVGLHYRTWNGWDGFHEPWQLNDFTHPNDGKNHHYDYDVIAVPPSALLSDGNTFTIRSDTEEHALEVLAPGPALTLRTRITSRPTRLTNLSARTFAGSGDERLILGFVIAGTEPHSILSRAIGPGLQPFGVTGVLADPTLNLFRGNESLATNDNWSEAANSTTLATAAAQLGAFALTPDSRDAAALETIPAGSYTLHVADASDATGVALAEVYDHNGPGSADTLRMINLSVRARVRGGDDTLIAGFVVTGENPLRVLLRGVGPSLTGFGISDPVSDPRITLFSSTTEIASNDDWNSDPIAQSAAAGVGAFALTDTRDAVLVTRLAPGAYTLHISGAPDDNGIALVEIYALP